MKMKALICGALFAAFGLIAGASAQDPNAKDEGRVDMPPANWLFVQSAASVTSDGKTLTLKGINPQTLMFSDRPERMTGDAPTAKFVEYWHSGKSDFEKDPPNATLSSIVDGKPHLAVVELTNPVLSGDTLTYTIKALGPDAPQSGQAASLFIDWWYGPRWGWRGAPGWRGGACWRGPYGGLHCRPAWAW